MLGGTVVTDPRWVLCAFCGQFTAVPRLEQQEARRGFLEASGEGKAVAPDGNRLGTVGTQFPALLGEVLDPLTAGSASGRHVARRLGPAEARRPDRAHCPGRSWPGRARGPLACGPVPPSPLH